MADIPVKILGRKYKQPAEVVPAGRWGVDFATDTVTGETISSATITIKDSAGVDVTASMVTGSPVISGVKVSSIFKAGTDGEEYHVQVLAVGSTGATYDADFTIVVSEV